MDLIRAYGNINLRSRKTVVFDNTYYNWTVSENKIKYGVYGWYRSYYDRMMCHQTAGYVCQRPAAVGFASEASGKRF